MFTRYLFAVLLLLCFLSFPLLALAQEPQKDSFFLAKKKGLLGRLGRSINVDSEPIVPEKNVNKYKRFQGKIIRSIEIVSFDFTKRINDTIELKNALPIRIAKKFHRNSSEHLIRKNLFFSEGDKVVAFKLADNEKYLRELIFLQEAMITVFNPFDARDSVDIVVITKDVFSIGVKADISSTSKGQVELREENLAGKGDRLSGTALLDKDRNPRIGFGASFTKRNIRGSFVDWETGIKTFSPAFNSGRLEETQVFTKLEKLLVSRYSRWTGGGELSYGNTANVYIADSLYRSDFQYSFLRSDAWIGYNIGTRRKTYDDSENRLRHFVATRGLYNHFSKVPELYKTNYNYNYADIHGLLFSYSLYKQNFYRTNFIYGFGRSEDVPEGLNASVIGGYTDKQGVGRAYLGLDFEATHFDPKGSFTNYTFRAGGFLRSRKSEDVVVLVGANHFTKIRRVGTFWRNRNFIEASIAKQFDRELNEPLFLRSEFGLPYFRNGMTLADARGTIKFESVFFNLKRLLGFRFAPFVFTDLSLLQPINEPVSKSNGFTAYGGGIRTRNENLVFGTIELKGFYFPRVTSLMAAEGMKNWRIEFNTNLQFKYNSSFIRKPTFILAN